MGNKIVIVKSLLVSRRSVISPNAIVNWVLIVPVRIVDWYG